MGMMKSETRVRSAAVNSLIRTFNRSKFSNLELDSSIKKHGFSEKDAAFFTALYYGVIERRLSLDTIISELSSRPAEKIDQRVMEIMRVGLYQLRYMDRVPDYAAVSTSVEMAGKSSGQFVNAVLRAYIRDPGRFDPGKIRLSGNALLSYRYSVPEWMIGSWTEDYGSKAAETIAALACSKPCVTLRTNTLVTDRDSLMYELSSAGTECREIGWCSEAVRLGSSGSVGELSPVAEGRAFVQDCASQLCVKVLSPQPGETVLDVCACPGGKSFSAAMLMENRGRIISSDIHGNKLSLVSEGAARLGIGIIETRLQDAREFDPGLVSSADRVICDVPCSGLGVIAKKPEIRYKSQEEFERLPSIQKLILETASRYVKPGGTLVYSTCTLRRRENDEVVDGFLSWTRDFEPFDFCSGSYSSSGGKLTIFPSETTDGFFIARMRRVN